MKSISPGELVICAKYALFGVHAGIRSFTEYSPEVGFSRIPDPDKDPSNQPLRVDHEAEDACRIVFQRRFRNRILVIGEESFKQQPELRNLSNESRVVALMDIVDGTDLLLRGFSNWCSAVVFFQPNEARILASVVLDADGQTVFFASQSEPGAYFQTRRARAPVRLEAPIAPVDLATSRMNFLKGRSCGPSHRPLREASVCYYGQKATSFLSVADGRTPAFQARLRTIADQIVRKERPAPALRLYNLGGIPMMLKLSVGAVDAVFDITGPKPHDVVPGAYIALKAGAYLGDLEGNAMDEEKLAATLLHPDDDGPPYILASSKELYGELLDCLRLPPSGAS